MSLQEREEVNALREYIKESEAEREKFGFSKDWDRYVRYYRNKYEMGQIPVNMVFAIARSVIPRVYFRNPRVLITPSKPNMSVMAEIMESIDNWLIHRIGMKGEMKKVALDAFLFGTGVIKTGFDSEFGYLDPETSREGSVMEQEFQEDFDRYIRPWTDKIEYDSKIIPGMPWAKRVNPKDFGVAPGYLTIEESPWVFHRYFRHIDDVKEDDKYSNTHDLEPTHRNIKGSNNDYKPESCEYVELFEISDMRDGRMKVLATGHNKFLIDEEDPLLEGGHKYASVVWNDNIDSFWGLPDTRIIEPQQLELNETRTQFQAHRAISVLKLLVRKGAISDDEKEKLISGDVGALVEVAGRLDGSTIQELKPYLGMELLNAANEVRRDIRETVGFSRNQLGDFDTASRRTATEAHIVQEASQIRTDERRDALADVLVKSVERMNQYIFKFWQRERVTRVVGARGAQWVRFTGPQIRGQYDLRVDADTARVRTSELRKQEAQELLGIMAQFPPEIVNVAELLRYVASQYEGIDERRILNIPEEGPMQAPMSIGELEQQRMMQQQPAVGMEQMLGALMR